MPALAVVLERERLSRRPGQDDLLHGGGQRLPRRVQIELECAGQTRQDDLAHVAARLAPRQDHPFQDRQARVAQHQVGAHLASGAESRAVGARTERRIERELPRLELGQRQAARGAGIALGKERGRAAAHHLHGPVRGLERRLDRVGEPRAVRPADHEPVDHHRDIVVLATVELRDLGQVVGLAVYPNPHEPLLLGGLEHVAELAFAAAHQRGEDLELRPLRPGQHQVRDLRGALALDRRPVLGTVRCAEPRPQEAQVVVDLGDRPDRGARVMAGALLLDRDGRREPFDRVHVGLLHQPEELAGVGGERFHVTALPLGVDRVEREGRLPRSRQPRDDGQTVARDFDRDVFEVVLAGAANDQRIAGHRLVG